MPFFPKNKLEFVGCLKGARLHLCQVSVGTKQLRQCCFAQFPQLLVREGPRLHPMANPVAIASLCLMENLAFYHSEKHLLELACQQTAQRWPQQCALQRPLRQSAQQQVNILGLSEMPGQDGQDPPRVRKSLGHLLPMLDWRHSLAGAKLAPPGVSRNAVVPAHLQQKRGPVEAVGSATGTQETLAQFGTGVKANWLGGLAQQESEGNSIVGWIDRAD